jgi:hypothetical protein
MIRRSISKPYSEVSYGFRVVLVFCGRFCKMAYLYALSCGCCFDAVPKRTRCLQNNDLRKYRFLSARFAANVKHFLKLNPLIWPLQNRVWGYVAPCIKMLKMLKMLKNVPNREVVPSRCFVSMSHLKIRMEHVNMSSV